MQIDNGMEPVVAERDVVITRVFDAPRALVFRAWTDPEQLMYWYAPVGCTLTIYELDPRPGGVIRTCIKNPAARDCLCTGIYHEVVAPERIVFTMFFSDEEGNYIAPVQAGMDPDWPNETTVTVTFAEENGKTRVTLRQAVPVMLAKRTGAYQGWIQMLDLLEQQLAAR